MSVDLRSRYLGLELKNPIVAAASPMTGSIDRLKRLEDAGVAAVVLPSLFEDHPLGGGHVHKSFSWRETERRA